MNESQISDIEDQNPLDIVMDFNEESQEIESHIFSQSYKKEENKEKEIMSLKKQRSMRP